jgi:uncharacterized protein (DUF58 family)
LTITRRFIYLLGSGILVLILSIFLKNTLTLFIFYNLICFILLIVDYFLSPDERAFSVERCGGENLSIYEKEPICLEFYNKSRGELYVELKDEVPDFHFKIEEKVVKGKVAPHEKKRFEYFIVPTKRGAFTFKNVYVKCEGRLKLCMKLFKLKLDREYRVYPNMKNLRKYRLNLVNNPLLRQGHRNIRMAGRGTSFESLREYVIGDEYRKINWQATARSNKPIVNQYEPEKNQHIYIFIDTGRPMSYTVQGYRKLDMVVNTALVLSDIVNQMGDQSALLLFGTEVKNMIMPGKGADHRNTILQALYHIEPSKQTSNYEEAFYYFKKKERHRSIVFLFTDFQTVEEAENMLKVLPIISKNNVVVLLLIKNESLEAIGNSDIKNREDLFNKGVALEFLEERQRIINLLNRKGVLCIECPAEKLELTAVNRYIEVKNRV